MREEGRDAVEGRGFEEGIRIAKAKQLQKLDILEELLNYIHFGVSVAQRSCIKINSFDQDSKEWTKDIQRGCMRSGMMEIKTDGHLHRKCTSRSDSRSDSRQLHR